MKTFNNRWWCVCVCLCMTKPTHIVERQISVRLCSAKTRRITNAAKEWKRKYTPSKTMHIRFLLDRHDGHHRFYFFFPSFFPLFWSLLFIFSCVLHFFSPFQMNADMRTSFFALLFYCLRRFFFFLNCERYFWCANEYILHDRVHQCDHFICEHLVSVHHGIWPVLFEWRSKCYTRMNGKVNIMPEKPDFYNLVKIEIKNERKKFQKL